MRFFLTEPFLFCPGFLHYLRSFDVSIGPVGQEVGLEALS